MPADSPDRAWQEWRARTDAATRSLIEEALQASEAADGARCAAAAHGVAAAYLAAFLEVAGGPIPAPAGGLTAMAQAASDADTWFARLRHHTALLDQTRSAVHRHHCEQIIDAMKEIRLLSQARAGALLGFSNEPPERDPVLAQFVVHSTTSERAGSILEQGTLYSFNQCVVRGLLSGPPVGVKYLLDPRRCLDFVLFHLPDHRFHAGEKVANSHRKGRLDEDLTEDYQPSVRLFFVRDRLRQLPGYEEDGVHETMVRDTVSLELLSYAVFPDHTSRRAALRRVQRMPTAPSLERRSVVAPADCQGDPQAYVRETNHLIIELVSR